MRCLKSLPGAEWPPSGDPLKNLCLHVGINKHSIPWHIQNRFDVTDHPASSHEETSWNKYSLHVLYIGINWCSYYVHTTNFLMAVRLQSHVTPHRILDIIVCLASSASFAFLLFSCWGHGSMYHVSVPVHILLGLLLIPKSKSLLTAQPQWMNDEVIWSWSWSWSWNLLPARARGRGGR